tara:strand:+ start:668 stop:1426 length:759 start_codon:yes stop_codon:yes gene_type:complete
MSLIQKNNLYKNPLVLLIFVILLVLISLNVYQYIINARSSDQIIDAKSEIESYKMTSLELKERVEKVTNNYASGGGLLKRVFELSDNSGVVELKDSFSFDRYHLVYISDGLDARFKWETRNKGSVIFDKFHFEFKATTVDSYISKPYDLNSNALIMTGLAEVRFRFNIEDTGLVVPISKTGDTSENAEFEIIKYKLEAIDSGLGDSNTYDSFELTIIPNSVEAPGLYSTFGENELITGELYLAEITIQRSER